MDSHLLDILRDQAVGEMLAARTRLNAGPQSPPSSQEGSGNADDRVDPVQVRFSYCLYCFGFNHQGQELFKIFLSNKGYILG